MSTPMNEVLADFLHTDVGDYRPRINEIAAILAAKGHGVFHGNGYELTLSPEHAVIHTTAVKREPVTMHVHEFAAAFHTWVDAL